MHRVHCNVCDKVKGTGDYWYHFDVSGIYFIEYNDMGNNKAVSQQFSSVVDLCSDVCLHYWCNSFYGFLHTKGEQRLLNW